MNSRTLKARCVKSMRSLAAVLIGIVGATAVLPMHPVAASAQSLVQSVAEGDRSSHRPHAEDPVTTSPDDNSGDGVTGPQTTSGEDDEGPDDTIVSPPTTVPDSSTPILFGVAAAAVLGGAATLAVRRSRRQAARHG